MAYGGIPMQYVGMSMEHVGSTLETKRPLPTYRLWGAFVQLQVNSNHEWQYDHSTVAVDPPCKIGL